MLINDFNDVNWLINAGFFLDRLKKTQGRENSSLKKITQNSSKKLKVSAKFEKITTNIDPNKGEIHCNGWNMAKIPHFKLKYCKNSQFLRGNRPLFKRFKKKTQ